MRKTPTDINDLQAVLDATIPEGRWLPILQTLAVSGVADTLQLQQATGLSRDMLRRTLEKLDMLPPHLPPALHKIERKIKRPGITGRAPAIYHLDTGGAAILRANGIPDARPCELKDDLAILHALTLLVIHLTAAKNNVTLVTDRVLEYGDSQVLRPDHRLILPDESQVMIEIEQAARPKLIPRILESLSHHQEFFTSPEAQEFLPEVRMIFNLPPGRMLKQTLKVWREAVRQVVDQNGEPLAFRLLAIPLVTFLANPEWDAECSEDWEVVSTPEEPVAPDPAPNEDLSALQRSEHSIYDDIILLRALKQSLDEDPAIQILEPDWGLFELVQVIYTASYDHEENYQSWCGLPVKSVRLLKEYLQLHPSLCTRLRRTLHFNQSRMSWSQANILHRMNLVIRAFMAYHGWRTDGRIRVRAVPEWSGAGQFGVAVQDTMIQIPSSSGERKGMKHGLEWVLWALFEYAEDLGLGRPEFW